MTIPISKEEILKAARGMSREERLQLIAEIAALAESVEESARDERNHLEPLSDEEVMHQAATFIANHQTLLRRLAE